MGVICSIYNHDIWCIQKLQGSEGDIHALGQFSKSLEMNCFYGETKQSRMEKEKLLKTAIFKLLIHVLWSNSFELCFSAVTGQKVLWSVLMNVMLQFFLKYYVPFARCSLRWNSLLSSVVCRHIHKQSRSEKYSLPSPCKKSLWLFVNTCKHLPPLKRIVFLDEFSSEKQN